MKDDGRPYQKDEIPFGRHCQENPTAFDHFWKKLLPIVQGIVRAHCKEKKAVDSIAQVVHALLKDRINTIPTEEQAALLAYTAARNSSHDYLRRSGGQDLILRQIIDQQPIDLN